MSRLTAIYIQWNLCRMPTSAPTAAAITFRLGGRITTGTPYRPQNVYPNVVPVRSGSTTPLPITLRNFDRFWKSFHRYTLLQNGHYIFHVTLKDSAALPCETIMFQKSHKVKNIVPVFIKKRLLKLFKESTVFTQSVFQRRSWVCVEYCIQLNIVYTVDLFGTSLGLVCLNLRH